MIPVPAEIQSAHLWDRIGWARENLRWVEPTYAVVFEDPHEIGAPCKILHPAPEWVAMATFGGLLPSIDAYLDDQTKIDWWVRKRGSHEGFDWRQVGGASHPYAAPIGPMTEEEAIEYLIQKDIPARVWAEPSNRPRFAIVKRSAIPTDRTHRNAWKLANFARAA